MVFFGNRAHRKARLIGRAGLPAICTAIASVLALGTAQPAPAATSSTATVPASGVGVGGPQGPTLPAGATPVSGLFTATSRTYAVPERPYVTVIYGEAVNYKGPEGVWKPLEGASPAASTTRKATSKRVRPYTSVSTEGAIQDCPLASSSPTTSLCSSTNDTVGWDGTNTNNSLIQLKVKEALPLDANVLNAELGLYLWQTSTSSAVSVSAYALSKPWTSAATWNSYDGANAWSNPGGDFTTTGAVANPSVTGAPGWIHWYPTQMVQEWANGTLPNDGLILADTTQKQTNDMLSFYSSKSTTDDKPYLEISWTRRGQEDSPAYTMQPFSLGESATMKVNLGSGNLFVNSNDLSFSGKGPPLLIEHNYDSRNTEGGSVNPWYSLPGATVFDDGSVAIQTNRYEFLAFIRQPDGTLLTPKGIDATMCAVNGTTCTGNPGDGSRAAFALTFNTNGNSPLYKAGNKMTLGSTGGILSVADSSGNTVVYHFGSNGIESISNAEGRTFKRGFHTLKSGYHATASWADATGKREVKYAYNASDLLQTYTDAEGHKTKYAYDKDGELSEITAPNGTVTKLFYATDKSRRITKIEGAEEDGSKGTWEYAYYEVGKAPAPCTASQRATVVTETSGNEDPPITYCANVWDEVERIAGYPNTGQPGGYTLETEPLNESVDAAVNLASGNLLVTSEDVAPETEDASLAVNRYYNSEASQAHGTLSGRWRWGTGPHVFLLDYGAQVVVHGPSGYYAVLTRAPEGRYTGPEEYEGVLTKNTDGTYTLENETRPTYHFNGVGVLTSETNVEGNPFTVSDTAISGKSVLSLLSPSAGKAFEPKYDTTPHVTETVDSASRARHYEYDTNGRLKTYTDAAKGKTEYEYDSSGLLSKITVPGGNTETITNTSGKVSEVTVTRPGGESTAEKFTYQAPTSPCNPPTDTAETLVTYSPGEFTEPYCFGANGQFTGPQTESEEEEEGSGTPEEVAAGTCYEPEVYKDCGLEEEPPEPTEDLPQQNYGIADNNWLMSKEEHEAMQHETIAGEIAPFPYFGEPSFKELKTVKVRRTMPWNTVLEAKYDEEQPEHEVEEGGKKVKVPGFNPGARARRDDMEHWVEEVKKLELTNSKNEVFHGEPIISFEMCPPSAEWEDPAVPEGKDEDDRKCSEAPPLDATTKTPLAYEEAMKAFFSRPVLAGVKNFTAWNEPNLEGFQPTAKEPFLAGTYWRALDKMCREKPTGQQCRVAAGDFADATMANAYNKGKTLEEEKKTGRWYFREYVRGAGKPMQLMRWAWHAYTDGQLTQELVRSGKPATWFGRFRHFKAAIDRVIENSGCMPCRHPNIWITEAAPIYFLNEKEQLVTIIKRKGHPAKAEATWKNPKLAERILNTFVNRPDVNHRGVALTHRGQVSLFLYYSMRGAPKFDSGLVEAEKLLPNLKPARKVPVSRPREIYGIYKQKTLHGG